MAHALILLNDLDKAKSRLAGELSPLQRQALVRAMFCDVVSALQGSACFSAITAMVGCAQGARLSDSVNTPSVSDGQLPGDCINSRVAAWLGLQPPSMRAAPKEPVLLVHADLPFLRAEDVSALLEQRQRDELLIATDTAGCGTNAIAMLPGQIESFAWGIDSAARHRELCRRRGQRCRVVTVPGFSMDIDTREDLLAAEAFVAAGMQAGPATSALLRGPSYAVA